MTWCRSVANNWLKVRGRAEVLRDLREIENGLLRSGVLLEHFGPRIRDDIVARTTQGVDINDRKFAPYAPSTSATKGRTQPVTLTESGTLQSAVAWRKRSNTRAEIFIRPTADRDAIGAAHHHGTGRLPQRQWFGYSPSQRTALNSSTKEYIAGWLRREMREFRVTQPVARGTAWTGGKPD